MKLGFIGAGNMGKALIGSIQNANLAESITAYDPNTSSLEGVALVGSNKEVVDSSDVIFLCVKPQIMDNVLEEIKETEDLVISIAAGITLEKLKEGLPHARVVRVMPNTPCLVGEMAAGYSLGDSCTDDDAKIVSDLLGCSGLALQMDEGKLDAVTGLSGSGPAFVARLIEGFRDAGVKDGLTPDEATKLALQTFKGTAQLLSQQDMEPEDLIKMVSSPGGTTVAGREILEKSDYKKIIKETIHTATKRSKELGK